MRQSRSTTIATAAPVAETNPTVAAAGTSGAASDAGHAHAIATPATPTTQALADAATSGVGVGFATDTHKHAMPVGGATAYARQSANVTKTSSTAFSDLTGLVAAVLANATYVGHVTLFVTAGSGADADVQLTGPAASTSIDIGGVCVGDDQGIGDLNAIAKRASAFSSRLAFPMSGGVSVEVIEIDFVLVNGANAGNVQVQGSQNISSALTTTFQAGSFMTLTRVA